jgi:hypothetical protein
MNTNISTASTVNSALKSMAKRLAALPNAFTMCDMRALAFGDLSSAIELCGIYLADFVCTNDKTAARKYLSLVRKVSEAIGLLAGADESPVIGRALVSAQECLLKAHVEFQAHVDSLLVANRATVQA